MFLFPRPKPEPPVIVQHIHQSHVADATDYLLLAGAFVLFVGALAITYKAIKDAHALA